MRNDEINKVISVNLERVTARGIGGGMYIIIRVHIYLNC